jgi:tripartite-type tricarboxylate transporter receptor subunit TctC
MKTIRCALNGFLLAFLAIIVQPTFSQDFPSRSIKLIVPFAPGGATDFYARQIAIKMGESMGQSVVIDNRPGAGTFIGVAALKSAPPDGYTMMLAAEGTYSVNSSLFKKVPYDAFKDFGWVGLANRSSLLMVVPQTVPANSIKELITLIASKPDQFSYGSPGIGTAHHLAMELFAQRTGLTMTHIAFKGSGPAVQELVAGRIQLMFMNLAAAAPFIKTGALKALALGSTDKLIAMPGLPTVAEAGFPGFEASSWQGIVVPVGTPRPLVDRLNRELNKALQDTLTLQKLAELGIEPLTSTPEQFAEYAKQEAVKWGEVIRKAKLSID